MTIEPRILSHKAEQLRRKVEVAEMVEKLRGMAAQILTPSSKGKAFFNGVADVLENDSRRESVLLEFIGDCATFKDDCTNPDDCVSPHIRRRANEIIDTYFPGPTESVCPNCGARYVLIPLIQQRQCEKCGCDIL